MVNVLSCACATAVVASNTIPSGMDEMSLMQVVQQVKTNPESDGGDIDALMFRQWVLDNGKFDNQSAMDDFITQHEHKSFGSASFLDATSEISRKAASMDTKYDSSKGFENAIRDSRSLLAKRSACRIAYHNQYFKPRLNLCGESFTGLTSCTEVFCNVLTSFFYQSSCHHVYYTNAENTDNGFGMCRCMPSSTYTISRYGSSLGNNIYSCSSLV